MDSDLLAGVPDDIEGANDDALAIEAAAEGMEEDAAERAAARERQRAAEREEDERLAARLRQEQAEAEDDAMIADELAAEAASSEAAQMKSGKRRVIQHAFDPSLLGGAAGGGGIVADEEEMARRAARAAKFDTGAPMQEAGGVAEAPVVPAAPLLTLEEIRVREERARKFEIAPKDPLESIQKMFGTEAFWEHRRDASAEETARPEAVHVFGTDKMSTEDLMLYWVTPGVTSAEEAPRWVEWVNDSSANVVFASAEACAAAMAARTVPLLPHAQGIDTQSWRTLPLDMAAAGKGLQLLFRVATVADIKPPKRAASRWYGEAERKRDAARRHSGGKAGGVADRRQDRRHNGAPYGRSGGGGVPSKEMRDEARARAIAARELEDSHKRSLAETIAVKSAAQSSAPSLADITSIRNGPGLADMAAGRQVEMVGGGGAASGATLAQMANMSGDGPPPKAGPPTDLRALLKGSRSSK